MNRQTDKYKVARYSGVTLKGFRNFFPIVMSLPELASPRGDSTFGCDLEPKIPQHLHILWVPWERLEKLLLTCLTARDDGIFGKLDPAEWMFVGHLGQHRRQYRRSRSRLDGMVDHILRVQCRDDRVRP